LLQLGDERYYYLGEGLFQHTVQPFRLRFAPMPNGQVFLDQDNGSLNGFVGQKVKENPLSDDVKKTWQLRNDKKYFPIAHKYSSENFAWGLEKLFMKPILDEYGYVLGNKIVDKNLAVNINQIPMMSFRDVQDLQFYTQEGKEYINAGKATLYISENDILSLKNIKFKINKEAHQVWFKLEKKHGGQIMTVKMDTKAVFYVYNAQGEMIDSSLLNQRKHTLLPFGGYVVFAGIAGANFQVALHTLK
jgi:hypothetical protein